MSSIKRKIDEIIIQSEEMMTKTEVKPEIMSKSKKKIRPNDRIIPTYSLTDSEYYFENGLRKVYPYYFTYFAYCKGRWIGHKLQEFYCKEFRAMPDNKLRARIESGLLLVNNQKVDIDYVLKNNDLLTHRVHRHELPVLATQIQIIHSSDDMLVIDKPPSMPVHPCGKYRHNSLLSILEKEHNIKDLHTIHRLDRLTSGVILFARSVGTAQKLHEQIRNRCVEKEYVCRVEGNFPDEIMTCSQPIEVLSYRIGVCVVGPNGKHCETSFKKLNFNGKSSTILCKPITGRMHQIRVHLQYLGHPILNDGFYNNDVFGPEKGKNANYGKTNAQLLKDIEADHQKSNYFLKYEEIDVPEENTTALKALKHYTSDNTWTELQKKNIFDKQKEGTDEDCDECVSKCFDPKPKDLLIYLHALRYKGSDWEYQSSMPVWAQEEWDND